MAAPKLSSLAEIARYKLNAEAAHRSRDLRIMVGHANLLDSLIIRLQDEIEGYLDGGVAAAPAGKMPTELVVVGEIELGDEDSEVWDCDGVIRLFSSPKIVAAADKQRFSSGRHVTTSAPTMKMKAKVAERNQQTAVKMKQKTMTRRIRTTRTATRRTHSRSSPSYKWSKILLDTRRLYGLSPRQRASSGR